MEIWYVLLDTFEQHLLLLTCHSNEVVNDNFGQCCANATKVAGKICRNVRKWRAWCQVSNLSVISCLLLRATGTRMSSCRIISMASPRTIFLM